eukprot:5949604-Prymnesium_polylepis.1
MVRPPPRARSCCGERPSRTSLTHARTRERGACVPACVPARDARSHLVARAAGVWCARWPLTPRSRAPCAPDRRALTRRVRLWVFAAPPTHASRGAQQAMPELSPR